MTGEPAKSFAPTRAAVIGAGPIGCATAAVLASSGLPVSICDADPAAVEPIAAAGSIELSHSLQLEAPIAKATTDIGEAVRGADLVFTAVPASAHEAVARAAAPHLEDGLLLVIQPGQTLSALAFVAAARAAGFSGDITPVQTLNTLFTARLSRPGAVEVYAVKKDVGFAALPASRTAAAGRVLTPMFPSLRACESILEVDLHNFNAVLHPPITLGNIGPSDRGAPYLYYFEGATPAVVKLVAALDRERCAILEALGVPGFTLLEWFRRVYDVDKPTLHEAISSCGPYATIKGPTSIQTRLLLEDIPTGLVPYCSFARLLGVKAPVAEAVVTICCKLYGIDFWSTGRSIERLGPAGLDLAGLLAWLGPQPSGQ